MLKPNQSETFQQQTEKQKIENGDDEPIRSEEIDDQCVKLILCDKTNNEMQHLCSLLSGKLRGKFIKSVSLNFDSFYQLKLNGEEMKNPFDVKISYNHKLIFISDYGTSALFVFDLITKRYLTKLNIHKPHYIAIESIIDLREGNENDALIVTSESNEIYKIDIKSSVKSQVISQIWKVGNSKHFNSPCGVAVYHNRMNQRNNEKSYFRLNHQENDENLIMVCDFGNFRIQVLGSKHGNLLSSIVGLQNPWMIDITSSGDLIVSEYSNRVQLIRYNVDISERTNSSEISAGWISLHQFSSESKENTSFTKKCCGIVVDKTTQNVIICDRDSNIIRIFNENGVFIKEFRGITNKPRGICIDELRGEILIVDSENKCIKIFGHSH